MNVRFSKLARTDLKNIHSYIDERSPQGAENVLRAIEQATGYLENFPLIGRAGRVPDTRELSIPKYPYVLVYTLPDAYHIDIERVLHTSMKFPPV